MGKFKKITSNNAKCVIWSVLLYFTCSKHKKRHVEYDKKGENRHSA